MDRRSTDRRNHNENKAYVPDITEIVKILFKRKLIILLVAFIPTALGFLYLQTKADIYRATASVILENENINMADFQDIQADIKFDNLTVPTQVEVISSPALIRQTIKALNLDLRGSRLIFSENTQPRSAQDEVSSKLVKAFQESLHVKQRGTSRVIEISFDAHSAENAQKIVNYHAKYYVRAHVNAKQAQAKKLTQWISGQIGTIKQDTLEKSRAVQKFRADHGMVHGLNSEDLIYQQISDIARQLSPIETKELDLRARVELLNQGKSYATKEVIESELIQSLKSRASVAKQQLHSLQSDYGQNHPNVIAATKEVEQINQDIRRETTNIRRSIVNELETVTNQKSLLSSKLRSLQDRADTLQEKQISLRALELEDAASRKILDNLLERAEEIKSQLDFTRADIRISSFSDLPGEPKGSKKPLILIALLALSGLLGLAVAFMLEFLDQGVHQKEDIKKYLNLKLLGTLPYERRPLAELTRKNRSFYLEEIKRIYIHLCAMKSSKIILMTSAKVGEGKSVIAVALAHYLHSIGKKVVLVDANTLTPQIAKITKVGDKPGLYELLAGTHSLDDVVVSNKSGLSIIPAGEQVSFTSDLLVAGRLKAQLDKLSEIYDYILIDSASALDVSDAEILSALADQTVIVAAWAKTPKNYLKKAAEQLHDVSKNAPSIILNKMPPKEIRNK